MEEKGGDTELQLENTEQDQSENETDRFSPKQKEIQEPQQQQLLCSDSDESDYEASSEKVQPDTVVDKSQWDKYNLDEYGGDQDEIEESLQGSNEKIVHIYFIFEFY
jgi:hypothetical protein